MLKCDVCGHALVMQADQTAKCECCGVIYSLEALKKKLQGLDMGVEPVMNSEQERLLKNAQTFLEIGKIEEAEKTYKELAQKFPDDYRGWWGCFTSYIASCSSYDVQDFVSESVRIALQLNPALEDEYSAILNKAIENKLIKPIGVSTSLIDMLLREDLPELFRSVVDTVMQDAVKNGNLGRLEGFWRIKDLPAQNPLRVAYEKGLPYVKRLNDIMRVRIRISEFEESVWKQMGFSHFNAGSYECFCVFGSVVGIRDRDENYETIYLPLPIDEVIHNLEEARVHSWRQNGRCVECGGIIKFGLFIDHPHCESCGAKYDRYGHRDFSKG